MVALESTGPSSCLREIENFAGHHASNSIICNRIHSTSLAHDENLSKHGVKPSLICRMAASSYGKNWLGVLKIKDYISVFYTPRPVH